MAGSQGKRIRTWSETGRPGRRQRRPTAPVRAGQRRHLEHALRPDDDLASARTRCPGTPRTAPCRRPARRRGPPSAGRSGRSRRRSPGASVAIRPSMSRRSSAIEWRTQSRLIRRSSAGSNGRAEALPGSSTRSRIRGQCSVAPVKVQPSIRTAGTSTPPKSPRSVRRSRPTALVAGERVEVALGEPQVPDRPDDPAALDEERPVAGHAGDDRELGVDRVRVVEAGHEQAAIDPADELVARRRRRPPSPCSAGTGRTGSGPAGRGRSRRGRPAPRSGRRRRRRGRRRARRATTRCFATPS